MMPQGFYISIYAKDILANETADYETDEYLFYRGTFSNSYKYRLSRFPKISNRPHHVASTFYDDKSVQRLTETLPVGGCYAWFREQNKLYQQALLLDLL